MSGNLDLVQVSGSQDNKYITINDAFAEVDAAMTEKKSVVFQESDAGAITLTDDEFNRHVFFDVTETATTYQVRNILTLPATAPRGLFAVRNKTARSIRIKGASQSGQVSPTLYSYQSAILLFDGTNVITVGTGERQFDIYVETPATSQIIWAAYAGRALWFYADDDAASGTMLAGWHANCQTAPSGGAVVFDVYVGAELMGTIEFENGSNNGAIFLDYSDGIKGIAEDEVLRIGSPSNVYGMKGLTIFGTAIG